jgi:hypothetical protein
MANNHGIWQFYTNLNPEVKYRGIGKSSTDVPKTKQPFENGDVRAGAPENHPSSIAELLRAGARMKNDPFQTEKGMKRSGPSLTKSKRTTFQLGHVRAGSFLVNVYMSVFCECLTLKAPASKHVSPGIKH